VRHSGLAIIVVGLAALCAAAVGLAAHHPEFGRLLYQRNSLYHRIFVYRSGSIATLRFGTHHPQIVQSQVDVRNLRRHVHEYTTMAFAGLLYKAEPERALVVGLGGGVIPRELHHYFPELRIDVAEIDPEVPPIAERFFGFRSDERLRVHVADGRMFIKKQLRGEPEGRYDLIILDAFSGDYIPFHLMTKEFLEEVQGVLAPDGAVVANVLYTNQLADAELKTFLSVFGRCQVYLGAWSTNAMLVAPGPEAPALTAKEAATRAQKLQLKHRFAFDLTRVATRLRPGTRPRPQTPVLTDDRAPVNWLRAQPVRGGPGGLGGPRSGAGASR
jgi:spermidine synthase